MTLKTSLSRWFGHASDSNSAGPLAASDSATHGAEASTEAPGLTEEFHHSFVRREAVLDHEGKIAGYQFSLIGSLQKRISLEHGAAQQAYDSVLLARLALQGVDSLLGPRLAFIHVSAHSLGNSCIRQLPQRNTVLMLDLNEELDEFQILPEQLAGLHAAGVSLGLHLGRSTDTATPLLEYADFVQVDVTDFNGLDLRDLCRRFKAIPRNGRARLQLVASQLTTPDDFQFCCKCGFDLFQGSFVACQKTLQASSGKVNRMALLPILDMLMSERSFAEIAAQLKNEPTMSYKLLRYLNSAAAGLSKPIDDLTEALVLIGRERFYRWTSLLFFDFAQPSYQERVLAERALVRARTLELLAGKGRVPPDAPKLFLTGLFSLLDQVLGQPLAELLDKAALPPPVLDALIRQDGPYADALALVVLGEADAQTAPEALEQALENCGITDMVYLPLAAEALVWTYQMQGGAE